MAHVNAGAFRFVPGHVPEKIETARELFAEYAESLGIDLEFQQFDREIQELPGRYAPPQGALILAYRHDHPCGCVALRPLSQALCEMKRLYVHPHTRGLGLGRSLAERIISEAQRIGYTHMRLDTLPTMGTALSLYAALGFHSIPAYCANPIPGAIFMEKRL